MTEKTMGGLLRRLADLPGPDRWIVGGLLRDALLGRPLADADFADPVHFSAAGSDRFARLLAAEVEKARAGAAVARGVAQHDRRVRAAARP